ncbi:hypothetical protein YC2023_004404 [Brassica napus]
MTSVAVRQHTQDIRGCLSVSVCVRQHTQDVRGCPCVSVFVRQHTQHVRPWTQHAGPWTQHAGPSRGLFGTHRMSVAVRVCPSVHTRRLWLSISTHISTLVLGLSTLTLPGDCSGDFGPRGLSVQYTQDVRGCPPAQTGRPWVSISTHRTSVAVRVCPLAHTRRLWLSISTHISTLVLGLSTLTLPVDCSGDFGPRGLSVQYTQDVHVCHCVSVCVRQHTQDVCGCPSVHISACCTDRTSVGVRQHTQDICGCPCVSISTHRMSVAVSVCQCVSVSTHSTSVAVHVCPCVSVSTHRTSVAVHQYTYHHAGPWTQHAGPWTQHAGPSRGLFGTSVGVRQQTQDVCSCPCVSVSTHRTCVAVHNSVHTGRLWVSASTHMTYVAVRGCPSAYTRRPWLSVCCPCVSVSTHRTYVAVHHTHRTSVGVRQHTHDVRGCSCCPSAHTGRPWLSVCVRVCPSAHTGRPCLSISTHFSTLVLGLSKLALPVDGLGDFGPRGLSVQYKQDVCGCPSAHTGRPWVSVITHGRPWLFVCVSVCPSAHTGRLWLSIRTHIITLVLGLSTLTLPVDSSGDFGPRGLSVQYTQDVRGCPPAHTGRPWLSVSTHRTSVAVRVCPSAHTGRPWLSISTHISMLVVVLSMLALPLAVRVFPCVSVSTHRMSVAVRVCLCVSVSTHSTSVAVRVCSCVSVSTHRTSVAVHQYTYHHTGPWTQHAGPWTQHAGPSRGLFGTSVGVRQHTQDIRGCPTLTLPVDCLGDFGPRGLSVQYTQDIRGCPPAHTGHLWLSVSTHRTSVAVRVCPTAHTGHPWLFVCIRVCPTYISTPVLGLSTLALLVDCSGDFGPRGLSVQYTQDVRGCPPAHTGHPWLSVSTHMTSVAIRVCPSAHTGRPWLSISTHISTLVLGLSTLALPVDCSGDIDPCGLSVQYTQYVHGCPSAHTGRPWVFVSTHRTSFAVHVCLCVSVSTHRTSVAVHHGLSVQYTQDVRGCPPAYTGRPWLSVAIRQHTEDVRGCPCVSVCVRQHTQDICGCPSVHISARWSRDSACWPFPWTVLVILAHLGCLVSTHRTLVGVRQRTHDVCGCMWLFASTHRTSVAVCVCPCVSVSTHRTSEAVHHTHMTFLGVRQHTQDVRGCPRLSVSTHRTSVAVHVFPCVSVSTHKMSVAVLVCQCVSVSTHRTSVAVRVCPCVSVCVRQHTQDVRGLFG